MKAGYVLVACAATLVSSGSVGVRVVEETPESGTSLYMAKCGTTRVAAARSQVDSWQPSQVRRFVAEYCSRLEERLADRQAPPMCVTLHFRPFADPHALSWESPRCGGEAAAGILHRAIPASFWKRPVAESWDCRRDESLEELVRAALPYPLPPFSDIVEGQRVLLVVLGMRDEPPYDFPPRRLKVTQPRYPAAAREKGTEGMVIVHATVTAEGELANPNVTGSVKGLDDAALACVLEWRFAPATKDGESVPAEVTIAVPFWMQDLEGQ